MAEDKKKAENTHTGHRARMKERYAETGLQGFSDKNVLEMLLYFSIPRKDTNELAHDILEHFNSFTGVMEASREELMQVKGVGEHTADLISLVTQVNKYYMERKSIENEKVFSSSVAGEFFVAKFAYEVNESAYALMLDGNNKMITCRKISEGVVNGTDISIRALCELALKYRASSVIISHNHPTGILMPSAEDEHCTQLIKNALKVIGIRLSDHIIVGGGSYISLAKYGMV